MVNFSNIGYVDYREINHDPHLINRNNYNFQKNKFLQGTHKMFVYRQRLVIKVRAVCTVKLFIKRRFSTMCRIKPRIVKFILSPSSD